MSLPFSTSLCDFRRSHDIDGVDRYSNLAMSLAITTDVGGLEGFVGIDVIVSAVDVVGTIDVVGVPILGNAIVDVAIFIVGIGDVTVR